MAQDLSINELLHDPIVRMMLRADGISLPKFAVFLQDAARRHGEIVAAATYQVRGTAKLALLSHGRSQKV